MRTAAVSAALLATILAGSALAQTPAPTKPEPQIAAKPKEAKPSIAQLAHDGNGMAQFQLGQALRAGKGVKRDPKAALMWFGLAASNGVAEAAAEIAKTYEQAKNITEAARWWYLAGTLGSEQGRTRFLDLFLSGQAGTVGGDAAVGWLEPRLTDGDAKAILALGALYENQSGPAFDPAKAEAWHLKAALGGHAEAQYRLGRSLLKHAGAWRLLYNDPEREKTNEDRDRLYFSRAGAMQAAGDDRHLDNVRTGMLDGRYWLTQAARSGHAEAQYLLGKTLLAGIDLPFDLEDAVTWLEAAAEQGHADALVTVAGLAAKGQGYHGKDLVRAWTSFDLAAQLGRKDAAGARDDLSKTMSGRQLARARQFAQDLRDARGM